MAVQEDTKGRGQAPWQDLVTAMALSGHYERGHYEKRQAKRLQGKSAILTCTEEGAGEEVPTKWDHTVQCSFAQARSSSFATKSQLKVTPLTRDA